MKYYQTTSVDNGTLAGGFGEVVEHPFPAELTCTQCGEHFALVKMLTDGVCKRCLEAK